MAALDDATLAGTQFQWEGRNRIRIRTAAAPGQALSVQVSYHPGWHATVAGQRRELRKDGLGLMWLRPGVYGRCEVVLDYDGGWELRLCRWLSWLALAGVAASGLEFGQLITARSALAGGQASACQSAAKLDSIRPFPGRFRCLR